MNRYEFYSKLESFKANKSNNELAHYGIIGQKWGTRRWQNADGTFNDEGKIRYFGKIGSAKQKKTSDDESNEGTYRKNKVEFDYDILNHLDKYTVDELESKEEELRNKFYTLHKENENKDFELTKKIAGNENLRRWSEDWNNAYDDFLYVKTKNAEEFNNNDKEHDWNYKEFISNYASEEDEYFERTPTDEEWDKHSKMLDTVWNSSSQTEEGKKLRLIEDIENMQYRLNNEYAQKEILEKTEDELKKNNYKVNEEDKIKYVVKDSDGWTVKTYKNPSEDDIEDDLYYSDRGERNGQYDGKEHYYAEKEYDTPNGKITVKLYDNGKLSNSIGNVRRADVTFDSDGINRLNEQTKRENVYNSLAEQMYNNRYWLFNKEGSGFNSSYSKTGEKYIYKMDKEKFIKEMNKKVIPKLDILPGDVIERNGVFYFKYGIPGSSSGSLDMEAYDFSGGNAMNFENFKLDDLLD